MEEEDENGTTTEIKWIGNEIAFNIGERPIKIWELLLGIVLLAIILPLFFRGGGGSSQGVTIVNTGGATKRRSAPRRRRKRREIKSVTYK